jgi:hypothetical protein
MKTKKGRRIPNQPIYIAPDGIIRFMPNKIVKMDSRPH